MARRPQTVSVVLLLGVTVVWGWTFVLVKDAIEAYPTIPFLGLRFLIAAAVMALVVRRLPGRRVLLVGTLIGLPLAGGYLLQTVGLRFTSPNDPSTAYGPFTAADLFGMGPIFWSPVLEGDTALAEVLARRAIECVGVLRDPASKIRTVRHRIQI